MSTALIFVGMLAYTIWLFGWGAAAVMALSGEKENWLAVVGSILMAMAPLYLLVAYLITQ